MDLNKDLYTLKEVAAIFDIELNTLYWWRKKGIIQAIRVGGHGPKNGTVRIEKQEIQRVLDSNRQEYMPNLPRPNSLPQSPQV